MIVSLSEQVNANNLGSRLLESIDFIEEQTVAPVMVTIVENSRLGKSLIQLESFMDYAEANGIDDAGYAIASVCEANHMNPNEIGFRVHDYSIIANEDVAETAMLMQENGYPVAVCPIGKDSYYYQQLDNALAMDEDCTTLEESPNLLEYCGVYDEAFDGVKNRVSRNWNNAKETVGGVRDKISNKYNTAKGKASNAKDTLSKKFAALKQKAGELKSKISQAAGSAKAFLVRQYEKVKSAMSVVAEKLKYVGSKVKSGAVFAKDKAVAGAGFVKDKAVSGGRFVKGKAAAIANKFRNRNNGGED